MTIRQATSMGSTKPPESVDILILGAGWTSTFLIPLLEHHSISFAATTTTGRDGTIPFRFDPSSHDLTQYSRLPSATTVLITFPLNGTGPSRLLTSQYRKVRGDANHWIQLGSTGIFSGTGWNDESAPYDRENGRAVAEDELREVVGGCVLNLAGLYGGQRDPRNWVTRVATTKEEVRRKAAVHLVHGEDVARAVLGAHQAWENVAGKRWIVADLHVYDWWDLFNAWGPQVREKVERGDVAVGGRGVEVEKDEKRRSELAKGLEYEKWVGECMVEDGVRALPREIARLGRVLDSRAFWSTTGVWPVRGRAN